jgi:hypothetical protein
MISTTVRTLGDRANFAHREFRGCLEFDGLNDWMGQEGTTGLAKDIVDNFGIGNKFSLSFWVNAGTNSDYLFFSWQKTTRTFAAGNWNQSDIELIYGGNSSSFSLLGFQNTSAGQSRTLASAQGQRVNGWKHCVINYDPAQPLSSRTVFVSNSRKFMPEPIGAQNPADLVPVASNHIFSVGAYSYNTPAITHLPIRLADVMFLANYNITDENARWLFNYGRNANYSEYPPTLMDNRFAHYPLSEPSDFLVSGPDLFARDISGNFRDAQIRGQGTTPAITPFY